LEWYGVVGGFNRRLDPEECVGYQAAPSSFPGADQGKGGEAQITGYNGKLNLWI